MTQLRALLRWNIVLVFFYFFFFNSSGYSTNSQFYKPFLLLCSQQVFMFGRMHFGKFWSKLSQRKILKLVILFDFYVYWTFFTFFFRGADHQWDGEHFATAGAQVDIWNHNRCWSISVCSTYFTKITVDFSKFHVYFMLLLLPSCRSQPINSFEWGTDTVISVRFNPGEPNLLATSARYVRLPVGRALQYWLLYNSVFPCTYPDLFCIVACLLFC